ncbi:MAG: BCCT family transporter, partial [Nocardioidaceae bacterium]
VSLVWFAIFGSAAISEQRDSGRVAPEGVVDFEGGALFTLLEQYPLASVTSVLVMVLVGIFFVSGADAASIVMGTLSEKGTIEPSKPTVIFWGVLTGGVAAVMLLAGADGDDSSAALNGLKNITIVSALPFMLVMVGLCVALAKDLRHDPMMLRTKRGEEIIEAAVIAGVASHGDDFALKVEAVNGTSPSKTRSDTPEVESGERARQSGA